MPTLERGGTSRLALGRRRRRTGRGCARVRGAARRKCRSGRSLPWPRAPRHAPPPTTAHSSSLAPPRTAPPLGTRRSARRVLCSRRLDRAAPRAGDPMLPSTSIAWSRAACCCGGAWCGAAAASGAAPADETAREAVLTAAGYFLGSFGRRCVCGGVRRCRHRLRHHFVWGRSQRDSVYAKPPPDTGKCYGAPRARHATWTAAPTFDAYAVARGKQGTTEFTLLLTAERGDPDVFVTSDGEEPTAQLGLSSTRAATPF